MYYKNEYCSHASYLKHSAAKDILKENGYPESPGRCVSYLRGRLAESGEFPHEVGLFLGYPPEDVSGFIKSDSAYLIYYITIIAL